MTAAVWRPFADAVEVAVVPPPEHAGRRDRLLALLRREAAELEVELGAPVRFVDADPGAGPRLALGPLDASRPTARWNAAAQVLTVDGPDLDTVAEALSLVRTLRTTGAHEVIATDAATAADAADRLTHEVATTYPAFSLRGIDWDDVCARHAGTAREGSLPAFQRWTAELADPHTSVLPWPAHAALPYRLRVDASRARLVGVPAGTPAADAGVAAGDTVVAVDGHVVDPADALARTGASPRLRPLLAGRRLLSGPASEAVALEVRRADGRLVVVNERYGSAVGPTVVTGLTPGGSGLLVVRGWPPDVGAELDAALDELRARERLVVDLRGNIGGALVEALAFRDRFVHEPTRMGWIAYSTGDGSSSERFPIDAEPAPNGRCDGPVRFLTDALTCSGSEDALLGLHGLDHVRVVGAPSGGGSGRPRTVRLLPGIRLSVSTALTWDRAGRCIEGTGIPVDLPAPTAGGEDDAALAADRSW